ncbi:MAG: methyltransferase domain-containing protein [Lapillicoccus sp.]
MSGWDGASYRRVNTLQQWLAGRALDDVHLDGVRSLLDVGCGDGRVTQSLAEQIPGARCVGIDPSPGMIAVAPASEHTRFEVGAVETMTFDDEFDVVVSFNALHWVKHQHRALETIGAAMHSGGRAVLVFVCAGPRSSLEDVAMALAATPRWSGSFPGFSAPFLHPDPEQWQRDAQSVGLGVSDVRVDDLQWDFGSRDAFAAWCAVGFGGWTGDLSAEDGQGFVDEVVAAYAAETGSDHVFRFMQLVGKLTKPRASLGSEVGVGAPNSFPGTR